jgi:hypothetical protein
LADSTSSCKEKKFPLPIEDSSIGAFVGFLVGLRVGLLVNLDVGRRLGGGVVTDADLTVELFEGLMVGTDVGIVISCRFKSLVTLDITLFDKLIGLEEEAGGNDKLVFVVVLGLKDVEPAGISLWGRKVELFGGTEANAPTLTSNIK